MAIHDGWYGAGTGAGYSNRAFIRLLAQTIAPHVRLVVLPVYLAAHSSEHNPAWQQESLAIVGRSATVLPIDNGTSGQQRFGGLPAFRQLSEQTAATLGTKVLPTAGPIHLILVDVPFFGVPPLLPPHAVTAVTVIPRSTAILHDPTNAERVAWEQDGLRATADNGGRVAAISRHMRQHLHHAYGIPEHAIIDLPNGLAPDELAVQPIGDYPLPEPARTGFLLTMGRAHPYKGFDDVLDALELLRHSGVQTPHLILAAVTEDETLNEYQRHLAQRVRDEDLNATLLTRFDPGVRRLLGHPALKAVIVPSRTEPFGRIPAEAYAADAAPVVATTAGGLAGQVIDGHTGYVATPADPGSLASAIHRALTADAETIKAMRAAARRFLTAELDYATTVRRFLDQTAPWAVPPRHR